MLIDYIKTDESWVFVDLRTPSEYKEGTIGNAVNIPIFGDEERVVIGTVYKNESVEKAKAIAIEAVSKNLPYIYEEVTRLTKDGNPLALFCARGGMRSQTLGSLLRSMGYDVYVIRSGYKGYRQTVLSEMARLNGEKNYIVMHGNTGVGKTEILKILKQKHTVIDFEGLAKHRGSLLGKVGIDEQVNQKEFEHGLYCALKNAKDDYIFVEAESRRIGSILMPQYIMDKMKMGIHILVEASLDFRADLIIREYIKSSEDTKEILALLDKFTKTFGHERIAILKEALRTGDYRFVAKELMIHYYDPKYQHKTYEYTQSFVVDTIPNVSSSISKWFDEYLEKHKTMVILDSQHDELGKNLSERCELFQGSYDEGIDFCASLLASGEIVAFPTETVYGLGANALSGEATRKIFKAKGRPSDNPLIVHISDKEQVVALTSRVTDLAEQLMAAYWPGPMTLVMQKSDLIPDEVTAGLETVAIRMPIHSIARNLIRKSGVPIAAPSANLSGKPSPTTGEHVIHDLGGRISAILCGDDSDIGLESTVVDVTGDRPVILRPGGITAEMIEMTVGCCDVDPGLLTDRSDVKPKSPGMKYTHYAPDADVKLFAGSLELVAEKILSEAKTLLGANKRVGILCVDEYKGRYDELVKNDDCYLISLGSLENMDKIASQLFIALRKFDHIKVDVILTHEFETVGIGQAIMNRLSKAAGNRLIHVV